MQISRKYRLIAFSKNLEKGGRPSMEYHLTLDMAKHLSMIERNDKGHQVKEYFIECEKLAKQVATPQIDYSKPEALLGVLNHLQNQIEQKVASSQNSTQSRRA